MAQSRQFITPQRRHRRAGLTLRSVVLSAGTLLSLTVQLSSAQAETSATATTVAPPTQSWSAQVIATDKVAQTLANQASGREGVVITEVGTPDTSVTATSAKPSRVVRTPKTTKPAAKVIAPIAALAAAAESGVGTTADDAPWAALRKCESGGRYGLNTGNGYYGAYQFSVSTWKRIGFTGYPHEASPATQDAAAKRLQAKAGWGQWPACARKLGLY